jgi:hypothetical protein
MEEVSEENKTPTKNEIDQAFDTFEEQYRENKDIRREMISQLRKQISRVEINPDVDKPMLIQSKLMVLKTLDDIIKSDEDMNIKRLRLKLQRKNDESNGMVGAAVVSLLKELKLNATSEGNRGDGERALEARVEQIQAEGGDAAKAIAVSDGEILEGSTVMPLDRPPDDPVEE